MLLSIILAVLVIVAALWLLYWTENPWLKGYLSCLAVSTALNTSLALAGAPYVLHLGAYSLTALAICGAACLVARNVGQAMPARLYQVIASTSFLLAGLIGLLVLPKLTEGWGYLQLQLGIVLIQAVLMSAAGFVVVCAAIHEESRWQRVLGMTWVWQAIGFYLYLYGAVENPSSNWPQISAIVSTTVVALGLVKTGLESSLYQRLRNFTEGFSR